MKRFTIQMYISLFFVAVHECQRMVDRNKYPSVHEHLNICELDHVSNVNFQCQCNVETVDRAESAKCLLFNELEPETSNLWDAFRTQKRLNTLSLLVKTKHSLNYIPTRALTHLPELHTFTVLYANITTVVPYAFANSTTLQSLELNKNHIQTLEKYSFTNLPNLKKIDLTKNEIREVGPDIFRNLPSLRRLQLEENSINVVQDRAFSDLRNLEELTIFRNQLTAISRNTFVGLVSLRKLDLHSNLLSELSDFTFAEMPNLRELIVEQNTIENVGEKVFYGMTNLEKLVMAENKLHILPDHVFTSLPFLHYLDLRDNLLQTFTSATAQPILNKLRNESFKFYIEGNRLECDCNLSWLRSLANETANESIKEKLHQLSCYMKASTSNYYDSDDNDQTGKIIGKPDHDADSFDRMYKLFNITHERLPCPEKRQANEIPMEQMSKKDNINAATTINGVGFSLTICFISFYVQTRIFFSLF